MIKYILSAIILIASLLFIIYKFKKKDSLPEKFKSYNFLSEGGIESQNYEIIKLSDHWKGETILDGVINLEKINYDTEKESVIITTRVKDYEKVDSKFTEKEPYNILWKIDNTGKFIDSIKVDYNQTLHSSYVIYSNNYYINWVDNNDKTKKKYTRVITDDKLSLQELDGLIKNASSFDLTKDYDNEITNIYLKKDSSIALIKSKKLYKETEGKFESPYKESYKLRFMKVDYSFQKNPNNKSTQPSYSISKEFFIKKEKHSLSLSAQYSGRSGRSGWEGIGYFKMEHNSESINFKEYAFNGELNRYLIYYPIEKNKDFLIFYLFKTAYDLRPSENTGIYILRKKNRT